MKDRSLNNKTLDAVMRRTFRSEHFDTELVDRATRDPQLFTKVLERIVAEQTAARAATPTKSRLRRSVIACASVSMSVALALGFIYIFSTEKPNQVQKVPVQVVSSKVPDNADPEVVVRPEVPPQPITGKLSAGRTTKDEFRVEKAILTRTEPANRSRRDAEPDTKFIPVSYTGDADDISAGSQVIRVEMKRSSLFAIGIDIPLENDDTIVKADLLVGRDGVTRAIRVVD